MGLKTPQGCAGAGHIAQCARSRWLCEVPDAPRTTTDAPLGRRQLSGVVGAAPPWGVPSAGRSTVNMTQVCSTPDSALRHFKSICTCTAALSSNDGANTSWNTCMVRKHLHES